MRKSTYLTMLCCLAYPNVVDGQRRSSRTLERTDVSKNDPFQRFPNSIRRRLGGSESLIEVNVVEGKDNIKQPSLTVRHYINSMINEYDQMVLMQWNAEGILERTTIPTTRRIWVEPFLDNVFKYTTPSKYGKVASLYVSDVILFIRWDTTPPIPLMVYTIRKDHFGKPNFHVIPNPYDLSGFSERNVNELMSKVALNATREVFHQRKNIIIWRGGNHGEKVREGIVAFSEMENTADKSSVWIDAKWSSGGDTNSISEVESAANYKYQLDIGGVSGTSWEGLRWKMCSGNLVFRIESDSIDWWHSAIQPWQHYIPVKEDLSDLRTQYDWAESHPDQVFEISQSGQKECFQTFQASYAEKVMRDLIETLPAATFEQIQQVNEVFEEQSKKENNTTIRS